MLLTFISFLIMVCLFFKYITYMPGNSYQGGLPSLEESDQITAERLESHVVMLCNNPTGRNYIEKQGLESAKVYISRQLQSYGYQVDFQEYELTGATFANVEAELGGTMIPEEIIIIGAHYDAVVGATGANDNASGVAAVLELARLFKDKYFPRTLRFIAFVNEEPPHFQTQKMGSYVYAKRSAREREKIMAMFSLETIGYYRDEAGSQSYPPPLSFFYPDKGNFIAFVGNLGSRSLVTRSIRIFREHATFPSEGISAPSFIPGISWSDQWSFWVNGYLGVMVTDTAPFRYPYYHSIGDTPDKLDYSKMVYVIKGMKTVIESLLNQQSVN
jgi:hypothetical protein